jgi:Uma2 family endonuclease
MSVMPVAERMTAEEFLALPDSDELRWAQLVEGELIVDPPRPLHQWVGAELLFALMSWRRAGEGRGNVWYDLGVRLDERNVFQPDVLWYREDAGPALYSRGPSPLPQLAVEIRSPSTWRYDIGAKKAAYERHGLHELWLVDTAAMVVLVFRRSDPATRSFDVALELERADTLTSPSLKGFELSLSELFPEPE